MSSTDSKVGLFFEKFFKFLASLKLAVIIIISLGIISAIGTIVEAKYDARYAQKVVFHSPWMYAIMALLCVNLINVMIDRLPWKKHHLGFILAHIGIIVLIIGSLVTKMMGIDGNMNLDINGKSRVVILPDTDFFVASSIGGEYRTVYNTGVDFITHPPEKTKYTFEMGGSQIKVLQYLHFAVRDEKIVPTDSAYSGPALRFQLQNANVNVTDWLIKTGTEPYAEYQLGPARVLMTEGSGSIGPIDDNAVVFRTDGTDKFKYEIYTKSKKGLTQTGTAQAGDVVETGWMGLQLRVLKFLPKAEKKVEYVAKSTSSGLTTQAVQVEFNDKKYWIGINSSIRVFTNVAGYIISFRNRILNMDFDILLKKFNVPRYQGTRRAMSYESEVFVPELGDRVISMNEPLKHKGYTFYQASFQEDEKGEPVMSILSVNKDPGRFWKYLGSALIVLGCIVMFYFKHYRMKIFSKAEV